MIEVFSVYECYFWRRVGEGGWKRTRKQGEQWEGLNLVFNIDDIYQYTTGWLLLYLGVIMQLFYAIVDFNFCADGYSLHILWCLLCILHLKYDLVGNILCITIICKSFVLSFLRQNRTHCTTPCGTHNNNVQTILFAILFTSGFVGSIVVSSIYLLDLIKNGV